MAVRTRNELHCCCTILPSDEGNKQKSDLLFFFCARTTAVVQYIPRENGAPHSFSVSQSCKTQLAIHTNRASRQRSRHVAVVQWRWQTYTSACTTQSVGAALLSRRFLFVLEEPVSRVSRPQRPAQEDRRWSLSFSTTPSPSLSLAL